MKYPFYEVSVVTGNPETIAWQEVQTEAEAQALALKLAPKGKVYVVKVTMGAGEVIEVIAEYAAGVLYAMTGDPRKIK